jgi:hypothetical protein
MARAAEQRLSFPEVDNAVLEKLALTVAEGVTELNVQLSSALCENVTGFTPAPAGTLVDLRIGSGGDGYGCANFNPGVQVPYGAMRIGPDTSIDWLRIPWRYGAAPNGFLLHNTHVLILIALSRHGGGYSWCDTHVRGFRHVLAIMSTSSPHHHHHHHHPFFFFFFPSNRPLL